MGNRRNPFTELGFGKYKGIHRMSSTLKDRAVTHENNRQRVVSSILLDLHIMAMLGIIPKGKPLMLRGAAAQNLEGSIEKLTQAAHCVPRQLYIGTETPQFYLRKVFPERAWAMEVLFGETDILPSEFNVCDSRAERYGLNDAFRDACQHAIESGHNQSEQDVNAIIVKVEQAFLVYSEKAKIAFLRCTEKLEDNLKPKYLFPKERAKWTDQLHITEQYAEALTKANGKEDGISRRKVTGLFSEYLANQNG